MTAEFDRGRGATDDKGPALAALFGAASQSNRACRLISGFFGSSKRNWQSAFFRRSQKACCDSSTRFRHRLGYDLDRQGKAGHALWTAWFTRRPADLANRQQGRPFRCHGGAARNPLAELMEVAQACVNAKTGEVKIRVLH